MSRIVRLCSLTMVLLLMAGLGAWAQSQTSASSNAPAPAATQPASGPAMDVPLNLKAAQPPAADDLAKGDPGGSKTGTVNDIVVSDTNKGLTLADTVNQVGQNRIAINFTWTLITGFLVMFMQAGFAIVETGLCRAKNANHTMMMNFMVYGFGLFAFWVCRICHPDGRRRGLLANLGGANPLNSEHTVTLLGQDLGHLRNQGILPERHHIRRRRNGDLPVPDGIHGHGADHRHRRGRRTLEIRGVLQSPQSSWARSPIRCSQTGHGAAAGCRSWEPTSASATGYADFAGSGVVHAVGGLTALALALIIGPRIGKYNRDGQTQCHAGHDIVIVLTGCFILAFGWFGFNPGQHAGGFRQWQLCASARSR